MKFLSVDYGKARIGIAACDETEFLCYPVKTLHRSRRLGHDLEEIDRIARAEEAQAIVVGLPLNADKSRGPSAQAAEEFARALAKRTPLPITLWDEFLTTAEAEEELIAADVSRRKRRSVIDQVAAVHLLEAFLRARRDQERQNKAQQENEEY